MGTGPEHDHLPSLNVVGRSLKDVHVDRAGSPAQLVDLATTERVVFLLTVGTRSNHLDLVAVDGSVTLGAGRGPIDIQTASFDISSDGVHAVRFAVLVDEDMLGEFRAATEPALPHLELKVLSSF